MIACRNPSAQSAAIRKHLPPLRRCRRRRRQPLVPHLGKRLADLPRIRNVLAQLHQQVNVIVAKMAGLELPHDRIPRLNRLRQRMRRRLEPRTLDRTRQRHNRFRRYPGHRNSP
jgi:hypothetical protein